MARPVELRLDLADLGRQELVVINERVLAEGAAGRRSADGHLPSARPERGRLAMVERTDGDRLVLLDGAQRPRWSTTTVPRLGSAWDEASRD